MNGVEQKNHKRVTDDLAYALEVSTLTAIERDTELSASIERCADAAREAVNAVGVQVISVRNDNVARFGALRNELSALRDRGFLGRMKWLFRGI